MKNFLKTLLQIVGVFGLCYFGTILIWELLAQPIPSMRLRDLQDVKHLVPPANGDALVWNTAANRWTNGAPSGGGGGAVNAGNGIVITAGTNIHAIRSGPYVLNGIPYADTTSTMSFGNLLSWNQTDQALSIGGYLRLSGETNRLSISSTGQLLLDGNPVVTATTNIYQTINVSNVTVLNDLTVNNSYTVNGHNNTMIITQVVKFAWATLTMSGSNVSAMNLTNSSFFRLLLTNDAFFVAPINFPGTNFGSTFQVHAKQDGTGGRIITLTNGSFKMAGSGTSTNAVPTINTNANAITILTFVTSAFDSTNLHGVVAATGQ